MGRYYSGDIEGKFWLGIQSSDDADFFGVIGNEPNCLEYYYCKANLPDVKKGIKKCKKAIGKNLKKLDDFFDKNSYYSDEMLSKETGISLDKLEDLLRWYARLELGMKIEKCIKEQGECSFEAEL